MTQNNQNNLDTIHPGKGIVQKILRSKAVELLVFFLLAVPGFFIAFVLSLNVYVTFETPEDIEWMSLLIDSLLICLGILMTLIGTKTLKKWKYAFVFLAFPMGAIIYSVLVSAGIIGNDILAFIIFIALLAIYINFMVKRHYEKKEREQSKNILEKSKENT